MAVHRFFGQVAMDDVDGLTPALDAKAATSYVDSQVAGRATTGYVDTQVGTRATTTYVDTQVGTRLPSDPTIVTLASISTGNISISSPAHLTTYRISVTGATATLAVPTGMTDGVSIDVQMAVTSAMTLTINASILRTTGLSSTFSVAAGKRWFGKLAVIGTTAYLLAATIQV